MLILFMPVVVSQADLIQPIPEFFQFGIEEQMVLSVHAGPVAPVFELTDQVRYLRADGGPVVPVIVFGKIGAGGEADPAGRAQWSGTVTVVQGHPLFGKRVDMFGLDAFVAIAAQIIPAHLVGCNDHQIIQVNSLPLLFIFEISSLSGIKISGI